MSAVLQPDKCSNMSDYRLRHLLAGATELERLDLTRLLREDASRALDADTLASEIRLCAGHGVMNWLKNDGVPYSEVLYDAAQTLKVDHPQSRYNKVYLGLSINDLESMTPSDAVKPVPKDVRANETNKYVDKLERQILAKLMQVAYENATPEKKSEIERKVAEFANSADGKGIAGLSTSAALLVLGNLGGFATFTLMSSVLSTLSFGLLGFGAYTAASSVLGFLLGPAGWAALGIAAVVKFGGPDDGQVVRLAVGCSLISQRLRGGRR